MSTITDYYTIIHEQIPILVHMLNNILKYPHPKFLISKKSPFEISSSSHGHPYYKSILITSIVIMINSLIDIHIVTINDLTQKYYD